MSGTRWFTRGMFKGIAGEENVIQGSENPNPRVRSVVESVFLEVMTRVPASGSLLAAGTHVMRHRRTAP